jgi:hypothetical protein
MAFQQNFNEFVKYMEESTLSLRTLGMRRISAWLKTENYCQLLVEVFQHLISTQSVQQSTEYTEKWTVA